MKAALHQFVERETLAVKDERFYGNSMIEFIYSRAREDSSLLFKTLTSSRLSHVLGFFNYDFALGATLAGARRFCTRLGIDLSECVDDPATLNSMRKIFERRIRYWEVRPMSDDERTVVAPADSKVLIGSLGKASRLFIKKKFFDFEDLLGASNRRWLGRFQKGDYAIFRLTPEKYHYNHVPVSGKVVDIYAIDGVYHSCNPGALISVANPYSKNKRVVTIIDTDVSGGTGVGLVAMIEVVALMIGEIVQCYSEERYERPCPVEPGMMLVRGNPKSLFRPGSSTVVLIFERGRTVFSDDLLRNTFHPQALSRFSNGFGIPIIETALKVRSGITKRRSDQPEWN